MPSLKELYEKAQATGKVEYDYFTGGGTSQPFNQTSIGFGDNDQPYIRLGYDPAVKFRSDDPTNTFNSALAATRDTFRITEFLSDFPNGPLFLAKQVGLQLSNPDTSYKSVNGTSTVLDVLDGPRFYNPLGSNTVAQVPAGVLGLHFTRHGLSPLNDVGYVSLNTTENNEFKSRLTLYKTKLISNNNVLNEYTGGPNSTLGLGRTTINSYRDSTNAKGVVLENNNTVYNQAGLYPENNNGFIPFNYETIKEYGVIYGKTPRVSDDETNNNINVFSAIYPLDFRKWKDNSVRDNYPKFNIHNRIGVTSNVNNPIGSQNTVDSINILRITKSKDFFEKSVSARKILSETDIYSKGYNSGSVASSTKGYYGRDIVKFRIEALNNKKPVIDKKLNTDVLAFRAYLENLNDNFNPVWKEFNYLGRGEPFYAYEKFSRDISFTFTLFAHSEQEMSILYTKLNYLMSLATPDYKDNQMRGNYIYLTIGDYIYRQPGVMSSLTISDHFTLPWEIALNEPEKEDDYLDVEATSQNDFKHYEIPKYLKIQLGFKPIHNFLPKRMNSDDQNFTSTFVTPNHMLLPSKYNRYLPSSV
jgi:hypothetical protein